MAKAKELREKSDQELTVLVDDLNSQIFALRNENNVHRKLEKPHLLKSKKRERAKVLTILRENQLKASK